MYIVYLYGIHKVHREPHFLYDNDNDNENNLFGHEQKNKRTEIVLDNSR